MKKDLTLWLRLYPSQLLVDLTCKIGYVGFLARDLAVRCRRIAREHGAKTLSLALFELD